MKFSKLPATFRSVLAALVNSGPLRTDKLARIIGTTDCGSAANTLCKMRREGLIFSKEKGSAVYCEWEATNIGIAVFNNRPDDVSAERADKVAAFAKAYNAGLDAVTQLSASAKNTAPLGVPDTGGISAHPYASINAAQSNSKQATAYAVVPDTGFQVGTYEDALECAKAAAIGMSKPYIVIAMVAEVLPPITPQPVVNVL